VKNSDFIGFFEADAVLYEQKKAPAKLADASRIIFN
jgi:hypothetical protein